MGKMGSVDFSNLKKFQKQLKKLSQAEADKLFKSTAKELAALLLKKVKKRTPVREKMKGDKTYSGGGTLRRAWTIGDVKKIGNMYHVQVINPMTYASYVEYGHRGVGIYIKAKKGSSTDIGWRTLHTDTHFTPGVFMLKISQKELEQVAPGIIEARFEKFLKGAFKKSVK